MKSIKNYLNSCLESLLDDDDIYLDSENDKKVIEEWIKDNYKIYGKLTISDDFVVDCNSSVAVINKSIDSLTNGLFSWGDVRGDFDCTGCNNLKSLEGAPEKVGNDFWCASCKKITSLEGAPEKVGGDFWCDHCGGLETLKGAPKEVGGLFDCNHCDKLESLEGAPKEIGSHFECNNCSNLKTLEGAPKNVGGRFYCNNCKNLTITDSDRKKYKIVQ